MTTLDEGLRELQAALGRIEAPPEQLDAIAGRVGTLVAQAAAERSVREAEAERISSILEVLYALAALDFSHRAEIIGDSTLDALAASANMVTEELEAAQTAMLRAKQEAEAATAAKSQFLANMSHEIRTPLTALIGFADLLAAQRVTESERLNYAMIIRRNGEHLLSVINDILDLSKIEAGKLALEHIECSPAQILGEVASFMRVRAIEANLDFQVELETPIPATVLSDPTRLRQSVLNLVGNAIKFTEKGRVVVAGRFADSPPRLSIVVRDTGMGMRTDQIARLFQPFEQVDASMSRRFGGTGLGLAICRRIALALGGDIEVASEPGRGSTFTLTTAVDVPAGTPMIDRLLDVSVTPLAGVAPHVTLAGRVLLAEDGPDNQLLVTTLLRKHGIDVTVVENGQLAVDEALDAVKRGVQFDVILMDMQMPVLDGYRAATKLRSEGYTGPIVALTAHAMEVERDRCIAAGCSDYLSKPIDRAKLVATLSASMRKLGALPIRSTDVAPLASSYADDPDMVDVIRRFLASLPDRVAAMQADQANGAALQRLAHQLKGAAGGYGFAPITDAAARVEDALVAGATPEHVQPLLDELFALCARAVAP
jgi:signal transduction histidine kinase/DNA-binding response OmpR family regulator